MIRKTLLVSLQTYKRIVFQWAFWLSFLALPLIIIVSVLASFVVTTFIVRSDDRPVGYVDTASLLGPLPPSQSPEMIRYADESAAEQALRDGELQAYFLIPPDYLEKGEIVEVSGGGFVLKQMQFRELAQSALFRQTPPDHRERINGLIFVSHRSLEDNREIMLQTVFQWIVAGAILLSFHSVSNSSLSDMRRALAEEYAYGTIDLTLTSISVEAMLAGKALGVMAAAFTPSLPGATLIAFAFPILALSTAVSDIGLSLWPVIRIVALCAMILPPAFTASTALAMTLESIGGLSDRGEQILSAVANIIGLAAMPVVAIAISAPDSPLAVFFSLFPLTSPVGMVVRFAQAEVPLWQVAASVGLVWASMIAACLFSARLYRAANMLKGQPWWRFLQFIARGK